MSQYIFNCTAIWLISLLCYDVLLRRQPWHKRNRAYLLTTLLTGLVLPLVNILPAEATYTMLERPAMTLAATRRALAPKEAMGAGESVGIPWLAVLYLSGVLVSMAIFVAEVIKLMRYHRNGRKHKMSDITIIETGRPHAPFSFMRAIYVSDIQRYTAAEWQMIHDHEQQHIRSLHIADLLLLHVLRILFWFHPLVYIYHRRLLMVHEYQADVVAAKDAKVYGGFLVEQAVLHAVPSITHSFHRSPIKDRLRMLTSTSRKASRYRMLLVLPLIPLFITCFAKNGKIRKMANNGGIEFTYPGAAIELTKAKIDTEIVIDPVTGAEVMRNRQVDPTPKTVNGMQVQYSEYHSEGAVNDLIDKSSEKLDNYLIAELRPLLEKLEDGQYFFGPANAIVGTDGYLVYYQLPCLSSPGMGQHSDPEVATEIDKRTVKIMEGAPRLRPLKVSGNTYPYSLNGMLSVNIRDHKIIE